MKTQTWGVDSGTGSGGPRWAHKWGIEGCQTRATKNYAAARRNGREDDGLCRKLEYDGKYTWVKGDLIGDHVVGAIMGNNYVYELRYDEGPEDRAWMEERDRNYVFRLLREGNLDREAPNLENEVPALYAEVVFAKQLLSREANYLTIDIRDMIPISEDIDLNVVARVITDQYKNIRQSLLPGETEIVKRLPPQAPLDFNQLPTKLLLALMDNRTVKTLIFTNTNLSPENIQTLAKLIQTNRTITRINLSNTELTNETASILLTALKNNTTLTFLDISSCSVTADISLISAIQAEIQKHNGTVELPQSVRTQLYLSQERVELQKQLEQIQKEKDDFQNALTTMQSQRDSFREQARTNLSKERKATEDLHQYQQQVHLLEIELEAKNREAIDSDLRIQIEKLNKIIEEKQRKVFTAEMQIQALSQQYNEKILELEEQLKKEQKVVTELEREIAKLRDKAQQPKLENRENVRLIILLRTDNPSMGPLIECHL